MKQNMVPVAGIPMFSGGEFPTQPGRVGFLHSASFQGDQNRSLDCNTAALEMISRNPEYPTHLLALLDIKSDKTLQTLTDSFGMKLPVIPKLRLKTAMARGQRHTLVTGHFESTQGIIPGMTFTIFPFGESFRIDTVDSETTVTMLRYGNISSTEIPAGTNFMYSGNVQPEAGTRTLSLTGTETNMSVHTQIFRNSWSMSDTMRVLMKNNPGRYGKVTDNPQEALDQHLYAMEAWLLMGSMDAVAVGGVPMRMSPGLREYQVLAAPQNIITVVQDMGYEELFELLESFAIINIAGYGSKNKIMYVDRTLLGIINRLGRAYNNMHIESGTDGFGHRYSTVTTDTLTFSFYHHEFLDTIGTTAGIGIIVDSSVLKLRYFRPTFIERFNIDASGNRTEVNVENGLDGGGGSYITEVLLRNYNPAASGLVFGINSRKCNTNCAPRMGA